MPNQSHIHTSVEWAKNRLDEMDTSVVHFEEKVQEVQSEARAKSDAAITKMKSNRDAFRTWVNENQETAEQNEAEMKQKLETEWAEFEDNIMAYFDAAVQNFEEDKVYFQARVDAQKQAWQKTIDRAKVAAKALHANSKAKADTAVAKLEKDANIASARLKDLNKAGHASWAAMRDALSESRTAFDKAMDETRSAFKGEIKSTEHA